MSTSTRTSAPASAATTGTGAVADTRQRTFALVFGIAMAILYWVADVYRWPLFTYHPGTDTFEWGWAPPRKDEGPAMYWYGWIASSAIGAAILGGLAALLPQSVTRRIPVALAWIVPLALVPVMIWSLKFYWRW